MKSNEAYETVEVQYEEVQFRSRRSQEEENENVYDEIAF